jgi:hypothetical protein
MTAAQMKRVSGTAARLNAGRGGADVLRVSFVSEPTPASEGLWIVRVRVLMKDGSAKAYECQSTERDLFAVREVPAS